MTPSVQPAPSRFSLDGRAAVVTGAASGIGAATTASLLEQGAAVVAVDLDGHRLAALHDRTDAGDRLATIAGDAADEACIAEVVSHCERRFGRIDGFVANAA